eukprot:PhF_6_TR11590/c0_g1_i4/m.18761/K14026/SEL1, SEL1L; SEL1 protein
MKLSIAKSFGFLVVVMLLLILVPSTVADVVGVETTDTSPPLGPDGSTSTEDSQQQLTVPSSTPPSTSQQQSSQQKGALAFLTQAETFLFSPESRNVTNALSALTDAAVMGNARAQFLLGVMYAFGLGVQQSEPHAILYESFAAKSRDSYATLALGYRHEYGVGLEDSCMKSIEYYSRASKQVLVEHTKRVPKASIPQKKLSTLLTTSSDSTPESELVAYYRHSAENGMTDSMMTLGYAYLYGQLGVQQNGVKAVKYFTQALNKNHFAAHGALGQLYLNGIDVVDGAVEANKTLAKEHFVNGTAKHDAVSYNGLGYFALHYDKPRDAQYARTAFEKAAKLNNPEGMYNLATLLMEGDENIASEVDKGMEYLVKAANMKQLFAVHKLGVLQAQGSVKQGTCETAKELFKMVLASSEATLLFEKAFAAYTSKDIVGSILYYLILSEMGFEIAQSNAAYLLNHVVHTEELEVLFPQNTTLNKHIVLRAVLEREVKQGSVPALVALGNVYYYGYGVEASLERARSFYKQAHEKRSAEGAFNSGYMHQHGIGVPKDPHLAKRYYDLAVEYDGYAYVPVTLALGSLYLQLFWENPWDGWPVLGATKGASTSSSSGFGGATKGGKAGVGKGASNSVVFGVSLEDAETILLYILVALLLFLVYLRCNV